MTFGWKVLLPVGLFNVMATAFVYTCWLHVYQLKIRTFDRLSLDSNNNEDLNDDYAVVAGIETDLDVFFPQEDNPPVP